MSYHTCEIKHKNVIALLSLEEKMSIVNSVCDDLKMIREKRPLVQSITNFVVMNETANALLCIGALPIMSHAKEEVEEMVSMTNALVLNIGTLTPDWVDSMILAGRRANEKGIPVILDPVGAGATKLRTDSCKRIMDNVKISVLRGNSAEVSALIGLSSEIRGVESISAAESAYGTSQQAAEKLGCVVAITGQVDVVSDGKRTVKIRNGHHMLGKVVGTGCISNVIIASFTGVDSDTFIAAIGGLMAFGIAGEIAVLDADAKPGTFHVKLYDTLYALDPSHIRRLAKIDPTEF